MRLRNASEIADNIVDIDNALKWGFNWDLGPFETWDAIGLKRSVERMEAEGSTVPAWVKAWIAAGHDSFYERKEGRTFAILNQELQEVKQDQKSFRWRRLSSKTKSFARTAERV